MSEVSVSLHHYLGVNTLNDENGIRGGRTLSTEISFHLTGKLLRKYEGLYTVIECPNPVQDTFRHIRDSSYITR